MPAQNILVVSIDGLRAAALGAYGNTSFPTPALDELASDSFLLDACFAPSPERSLVFRALWQSLDPLRTEQYASTSGAIASLPQLLRARGQATALITDDESLPSLSFTSEFDECTQISDVAGQRAKEVGETAIARLLATGAETLRQPDRSQRVVWIHSRGMYGPWDAPIEFQESLLDEGDPLPIESTEPPDLSFGDADDPDTPFRYTCAYGGQIMALDDAWEGLMRAINDAGRGDWLVMLLGTRGFPLGEHCRIGGVDDRLYADQLHVPWLVRFPNGAGRLARTGSLVSHMDVLPTILDWLQNGAVVAQPPRGHHDGVSIFPLLQQPSEGGRELLLSSSAGGARAIRTRGWSLVQHGNVQRRERANDLSARTDAAEASAELYVRPDDRWEANDIAGLRPAIAEGLGQRADEAAESLRRGAPILQEPLPDELRSGEF